MIFIPKREITYEEVLKYIKELPFHQFKDVVNYYAYYSKADFQREMTVMVTYDFQERLKVLGINTSCPKCNSVNIIRCGKQKYVQRYKCNDCSTRFTLFSGTVLEKTQWHWDIWIKVLEMTINEYSIPSIINVLEKDYGCIGINYKTVWLWRIKLVHVIASIPMPILSGVIQIDETFVRESQKGSRSLVSYLSKNDVRMPRYGRKPSEYGVMGSEFATITTAIDNTGHCVCKVTGLGKLTKEIFFDLFESHLDSPSFICSDANSIYSDYCELKKINHYEKPSNYLTEIQKAGYVTPNYLDKASAQTTKERNDKILSKLYSEGLIDKITNRGYISYEAFKEIKTQYFLSLGRVNELHKDIKHYIYSKMTNVSTKYLQDYIGFFTYMKNWTVDHGSYPSSRKDAEKIFIEILKNKKNITTTEIKEKELDLPKPTSRYITLLKKETEKARLATANKYFKFDEEDGVKTFNKREYLLDKPKYKLWDICKEYKLTKFRNLAQWSLVSLLLKQPRIDDVIYKLLLEDRSYKIADEDLEAIRDGKYKN